MGAKLVGERRAVSLFVLGFFATMFGLGALAVGGPWVRFFGALGLTYAVAFFALAAGWFWGRWFAMGIGLSGVWLAVIGMINVGLEPGLGIWGGLHLAIYLPLLGETMASRFEGRADWRKRWNLDEFAVERLKRAVSGAATGLPTLIIFALAPRQDQMAHLFLPLLAAAGLFGLLRMRFWGVALLGLSGAWAAAGSLAMDLPAPALGSGFSASWFPSSLLAWSGLLAATTLLLAVAPYLAPAWRYLRHGDFARR